MPDTTDSASTPGGQGYKYGQRRLALNVRVLMAQHGYRDISKLYRELISRGCDISYSQFKRIVDNQAEKLNTNVLDALLNLFDCRIDELFITLETPPD